MLAPEVLYDLCSTRFDRFRTPLKCPRRGTRWFCVTNAHAILYLRGDSASAVESEVPLWQPLNKATRATHTAEFSDIVNWCRDALPWFDFIPEYDRDWCVVNESQRIDRGLMWHFLKRVHARTVRISWPSAEKVRPLVLRPDHGDWTFCVMPARHDATLPLGDPLPRGILSKLTPSQEGDEVR